MLSQLNDDGRSMMIDANEFFPHEIQYSNAIEID